MTDQYLRKASLTIGQAAGDALDVSALRFTFQVTRGDSQVPNKAVIKVYNMRPETIARVQKEFTRVVLQAGYEGNYGLIFDGTVMQTRRLRENQTDTVLEITAADGDAAYNFAYVATTLSAGSTAQDHFNVAAKAMGKHGVRVGYVDGLTSNKLPRAKVMFGMARDALACTARNTATTWSIQDGKIQVVPQTSYMPGEIPLITWETGLIAHPEQQQNGVKVSTLLNPSLKIGTLIQLFNDDVQRYNADLATEEARKKQAQDNGLDARGLYYVMVADHAGDTHGDAWRTDLTCLAADPTLIGSKALRERAQFGTTAPIPGSVKSNG